MKTKIFSGGLAADDRGSLRFVNVFNFADFNIKRMYQIENNAACQIRAWHGHKIENKFFYCVSGSVKVVASDFISTSRGEELVPQSYEAHVLSALQPKILHIPAGMANGFKILEPDTKIIVFSDLTMDEAKFDDYRITYVEDGIFDTEIR